jgi:hypothetical protein
VLAGFAPNLEDRRFGQGDVRLKSVLPNSGVETDCPNGFLRKEPLIETGIESSRRRRPRTRSRSRTTNERYFGWEQSDLDANGGDGIVDEETQRTQTQQVSAAQESSLLSGSVG